MKHREKLVVLPGWSNNGERLWHQIQHLASRYDVVSVAPSAHATAEDMADDVLRQAPPRFILLGHSLGGLVAQHMAIKAPRRVSRLILAASFPGGAPQALKTSVFRHGLLAPMLDGGVCWPECAPGAPREAEDLTVVETFAACRGLSARDLIDQTRLLFSAPDISAQLAQLSMPTLLVHGRQDQLFPMAMQQLMLSKLPNAVLRVVEDCGHLPSPECARSINEVIMAWLAQPGPASCRAPCETWR